MTQLRTDDPRADPGISDRFGGSGKDLNNFWRGLESCWPLQHHLLYASYLIFPTDIAPTWQHCAKPTGTRKHFRILNRAVIFRQQQTNTPPISVFCGCSYDRDLRIYWGACRQLRGSGTHETEPPQSKIADTVSNNRAICNIGRPEQSTHLPGFPRMLGKASPLASVWHLQFPGTAICGSHN